MAQHDRGQWLSKNFWSAYRGHLYKRQRRSLLSVWINMWGPSCKICWQSQIGNRILRLHETGTFIKINPGPRTLHSKPQVTSLHGQDTWQPDVSPSNQPPYIWWSSFYFFLFGRSVRSIWEGLGNALGRLTVCRVKSLVVTEGAAAIAYGAVPVRAAKASIDGYFLNLRS